MPQNFENHIYYEVRPEYRNHGYATAALKLLVEEAVKLQFESVTLVTAEDNVYSQKIIEANKGALIDKQLDTKGVWQRKYIIDFIPEP